MPEGSHLSGGLSLDVLDYCKVLWAEVSLTVNQYAKVPGVVLGAHGVPAVRSEEESVLH